MAANYWQPVGASTDGNAAANWSLGRVPIAGDTATFVGDDGGHPEWENACTFTVALTCDGIDAQATYSGAIDLGSGLTYNIGSVGLTFAHSGNLTIASVISISGGNINWSAVAGTITTSACDLYVASGTCIWTPKTGAAANSDLRHITIPAATQLTVATSIPLARCQGLLDVSGTLSISNSTTFTVSNSTNGDVKIRSGGTVSGSGNLTLSTVKAGGGLSEQNGTISCVQLNLYARSTGMVIVPCTISSSTAVRFQFIYADGMLKPNAGTITVGGSLTINYGSSGTNGTLDLTNGCTIAVQGNLILDNDLATNMTVTAAASAGQIKVAGDITNTGAGAGTWVWTPGTVPIIQFTGAAANQSAVLPGAPAVEIDKSSGKVTPASIWTSAVTITSGTLEFTAANLQNVGPLYIAAAGTLNLVAASPAHTFAGVDNYGTISIGAGTYLNQAINSSTPIHNRSTGLITGAGLMRVGPSLAGCGIATQAGTINVATLSVYAWSLATICAGTYASATTLLYGHWTSSKTIALSGSYSFLNLTLQNINTGAVVFDFATAKANLAVSGNLTLDADSTGGITVTCAGKESTISVGGNIVDQVTGGGGGTVTWTKGTSTGELTINGTGAQAVDFPTITGGLGHVVVNKSAGTATLNSALSCESLTISAGTVDPNGQTITTVGACTVSGGANFVADADAFNGCTWVVGGNLNWRGAPTLALNATAGWTLTVSGVARVSRANVAYSDATGSAAAIRGYNCTDVSDNTNWMFRTGSGGRMQYLLIP